MMLFRLFSLLLLCCSCALLAPNVMGQGTGSGVSAQPTRLAMPDIDRDWRAADFSAVAKLLRQPGAELPRFASVEGTALLQRMTSTDNFSRYRRRATPIMARMQEFSEVQSAINDIMKVYFARTKTEPSASQSELAAIFGYMLRATALGVELVEEAIPTFPRDASFAERMGGVRQLKAGVMQVFVGAHTSLSVQKGFTAKDKSSILESMAYTVPTLMRAFDADLKRQASARLKEELAIFTAQQDKQNILSIIEDLGRTDVRTNIP